jgi:catechol 2,3-dioxygenase-like lactoylglutathione lyase family enzyme
VNLAGIDHVSINVADAQESYDFYGRILGLRRVETVDCGEFDITYFGLPNGGRLELFYYHGRNAGAPPAESDVGLRHIAFEVRDIAAHEQQLRAAGVEITLPTCELPNLGVRVLLFLDPNGVTLEFCEQL